VTSLFSRSALTAILGTAAVLACVPAASASASGPASPRIVAHFNLQAGQTPENAAIEPDGSADITLAAANQVARVTRAGKVTIIATLPPSGQCPVLPGPAATGIVRAHDGTLYVAECSATSTTGIWRLRRGSAPVQIAKLPANGFPNGMVLDDRTGSLYVSDSLLGTVWKVPARGGVPSAWATGPELDKVSFLGANGLALRHGAIWVGNLDQGLIARIPIRRDGSAGPAKPVVTGLTGEGLDDFSVVGRDNTIIAALNMANEVIAVTPGRQPRVLLTAADGLSTPTSVRVHAGSLYVTSAAYFTSDPNLLVAPLGR
jgi:streptogramin lyase